MPARWHHPLLTSIADRTSGSNRGHAESAGGGRAAVKAARVSVMQAPPLYHTTGEVLDVIPAPGLERSARFPAFFVSAADNAPLERINP